MNIGDLRWTFSLSEEEASRLPSLLAQGTFEQVTDSIATDMRVLCCHRSTIKGTDFNRPVFTVQVERLLFDRFFNSPYGYRAAYYRSPGTGIEANSYCMSAIAPRLVAHQSSAESGLRVDLMLESLSTPSAKAWLAEHGKEIDPKCSGCEGEWSSGSSAIAATAEIKNGRWESASGQKAEWGRKAPFLTKLRFMGAFIDNQHNEFIPHDKRFRASDIYAYGWS